MTNEQFEQEFEAWIFDDYGDVWQCPKCGETGEPTVDGGCTSCSKAEVDL